MCDSVATAAEDIDAPRSRAKWVHVYGNFIPRHVFGRFHALLAYIRCAWAALILAFFHTPYDVTIVDQVNIYVTSTQIPYRLVHFVFPVTQPYALSVGGEDFHVDILHIQIYLHKSFSEGHRTVVLPHARFPYQLCYSAGSRAPR